MGWSVDQTISLKGSIQFSKLAFSFLFHAACFASRVEERLMNTILKDYNKRARPVEKETDVVHIVLDIALPQVMKVVSVN